MKRVCALILCGALMIPQTFASAAASWPAWAEDALSWGREVSISQEFLTAPESVVTRGMAAQLLYGAAGQPAVHGACPFSDVPGDVTDAVTWAAEQGYVSGVGGGRYEPGRFVTRQEFSVILWRQAGSPSVPVQDLDIFQDSGAVAEWARTAVLWSLQSGAMNGRSADQLAPEGTITVAEALVMLERVRDLPDVTGMRKDLEALTASQRPVGSEERPPRCNI